MFTAALMLFLSSPFLMLRLSDNTGSFPKALTRDEEKEYLTRYINGDQEARAVLIERNLRLVPHVLKKYYTPNCDYDDLISIGTIGLIKGVSTYKPEKNVRLATYVSTCIENAIGA